MFMQARAIIWAQFRGLINVYSKPGRAAAIFTIILSIFWYSMWIFGAFGAFVYLGTVKPNAESVRLLSYALLLGTLYWQMIPVMLATTGLSLDLKKLVVYPVPITQLFTLEVILRVTTAFEVLVLTAGAMIGALRNQQLPWWSALAFVPFIVLNLLFSAGIREVLLRVFAKKVWREIAAIVLVFLGLLPQLIIAFGWGEKIDQLLGIRPSAIWPWQAAARLIVGEWRGWPVPVLLLWTAGSWWFGRSMFARSMRFDASEVQASTKPRGGEPSGFVLWLRTVPRMFLPDPQAAIVEKEFLSLIRSPRFRLLFIMGVFFSVIILNTIIRRDNPGTSWFAQNYLTMVSVYSLLFLGELCFWNSFAFDRSAAQIYFVMPVKITQVLAAKNFTAGVVIFLELTAVILLCRLLQMPMTLFTVVQAYAVCAVVGLLLVSAGNITSIRYPRGVDPMKSLRSSYAGKAQMFAMLFYPIAAAPVALAYLAEYAFDTPWAFFGVILLDSIVAVIIYFLSLESAANTAFNQREQMLTDLSRSGGPVSA